VPKSCEEKPVSISMKRGFLAGTLTLPYRRSPAKGWPAVLMCHGFTGNRMEAHFMFVKASRQLAAHGIASLRFDFQGSGESSGRFEDMTILTEVADALAAWEYLLNRPETDPERQGIIGLSLGGGVTSLLTGGLHAEERPPRCCALWSAVGDLAVIWEERFKQLGMLKRALMRFPIAVGAFRIGERFFKEMKEAPRPVDAMAAAGDVPVLVIHGSKDEVVPVSQARDYLKKCGKKRARLMILHGADHVYNRPDWERKVIDTTREWLKKRL